MMVSCLTPFFVLTTGKSKALPVSGRFLGDHEDEAEKDKQQKQ